MGRTGKPFIKRDTLCIIFAGRRLCQGDMREEEAQFVLADLIQIVGDTLHLLSTVIEAVIALIFFYNPADIVHGYEMGASPAESVVRRAVVPEVGASCIPVVIC